MARQIHPLNGGSERQTQVNKYATTILSAYLVKKRILGTKYSRIYSREFHL